MPVVAELQAQDVKAGAGDDKADFSTPLPASIPEEEERESDE